MVQGASFSVGVGLLRTDAAQFRKGSGNAEVLAARYPQRQTAVDDILIQKMEEITCPGPRVSISVSSSSFRVLASMFAGAPSH